MAAQRTYAGRMTTAPLVRWGAVLSGAVVGLAVTLLMGSLWVALAFGSHNATFYHHLAGWFAGTAIGGVFLAALIAGAASGTRGVGSGLANGLTTWGAVTLAAAAGGIPAISAYGSTRPITVSGVRVAVTTVQPWTTFWALLIGLAAAVIGGLVGGSARRRTAAPVAVDPAVTDLTSGQYVPAAAVPAAPVAPGPVVTAGR